MDAAADVLASELAAAGGARGQLSLGWTMKIRLGDGYEIPQSLDDVHLWEASQGYGDNGNFGWVSLSKRMALYYMTGDEFSAREFVRLAFPDEQALAEIRRYDSGLTENEREPLVGAYHYNAHMLILYWDLIEESPVFSDEERLKITNEFSRQLAHRAADWSIYHITQAPIRSGDRHADWAANCIYLLGRYFNKDYPDPRWQHCIDVAKLHFSTLYNPEGTACTNDSLFWHQTCNEPTLVWAVLTGDREAVSNGAIPKLLLGPEILATGADPDPGLKYTSLAFAHKAAYLTGDAKWLWYRDRTAVDTSVFRLGQSFWPDTTMQPMPPVDMVGKWTLYRPSRPLWAARGSNLGLDEVFYFGSYRSGVSPGDDYILVDGYNGASRAPYHVFSILDLRLKTHTLLNGYENQVGVRVGGMVEPRAPMDAGLTVISTPRNCALAVGEVPNMPFCNWRRHLLHRDSAYSFIADELTFDSDSRNAEITTKWEALLPSWDAASATMEIAGEYARAPQGQLHIPALASEWTSSPAGAEALQPHNNSNSMLLNAVGPGAWMETRFTIKERLSGDLLADLHNYKSRGKLRFLLDGKQIGKEYDHYSASYAQIQAPLAPCDLQPGEHTLRIEITGKHPRFRGLPGQFHRPVGCRPECRKAA